MIAEPRIAFAVGQHERPAVEVRVNFGVFAGRNATPAEIDDLGRLLLVEVDAVTVVAEDRRDLDARVETSVHLVRIEVAPEYAPPNDLDRLRLEHLIVDRAEQWARACIAHRHAPDLD